MPVVESLPNTILIGGAPATGKSSAAVAALDALGRGAIVEVDRLRSAQARRDWRDRTQHAIAVSVTVSCAQAFLENGVEPVLIVDTFGRTGLEAMREGLEKRGASSVHVFLWCAADELRSRSERRGDRPADHQRARLLSAEIESRGTRDGSLLDCTRLTSTQTGIGIFLRSRWVTTTSASVAHRERVVSRESERGV